MPFIIALADIFVIDIGELGKEIAGGVLLFGVIAVVCIVWDKVKQWFK